MKQLHIATIALLAAAMASCSEDAIPEANAPVVNEFETKVTNIYRTGATLQTSIDVKDNSYYDDFGIIWSKTPSMSDGEKLSASKEGVQDHVFSTSITGLLQGQTYYYSGYVTSGSTTIYGNVNSFTTPQTSAPLFSPVEVSNTSYTYCDAKALLTDNGVDDISATEKRPLIIQGFIYKKVENEEKEPLTLNTPGAKAVPYEGNDTEMVQRIVNLEPNSTYAIQAYGVLYGVGYSSEVKLFHTPANEQPALSTTTVSDIEATSFRVSASIINPGSTAVTERGFCYSTDNNDPKIGSSTSIKADGTDSDFSTTLSDMLSGAKYYIRSYAKNGNTETESVGYGDVIEVKIDEKVKIITTSEYPLLPVVIDSCFCTNVGNESFTVNASIDYGKYIHAYEEAFSANPEGPEFNPDLFPISMTGFIYSTVYPEPSIADQRYNDMLITNSPFAPADSRFSVTIPISPAVTTYYLRAFAINGYGTTYSKVVTLRLGPGNTQNPFPGVVNVRRR